MNTSTALLAVGCMLTTAAGLSAQWGPIPMSVAPTPRSGAMLAFDAAGNRTLLFGGNFSNDFWQLAGGVWSEVTPPLRPTPRRHSAMAADPLTGAIVLYGGQGTGSAIGLDDTWTWDGTTWTAVSTPVSPGGFTRHAMAFDVSRQTTVLFGGRHDANVPNQLSWFTWEFANGAWTQAWPALNPPPLVGAAMAWHPATGQMLLFGGADGNDVTFDHTWTYDGLTWQQTNTTGPRPPARAGAQLLTILSRGVVMLCGGRDLTTMEILNDTWEHDGVAWHQVTPYSVLVPARADVGMAYDSGRNRVVAFGGVIANNGLLDDTWEYGAHFQRFGSGCAGTAGVPQLQGGVLPSLGALCSATLSQLPPASPLAVMVIGFSRTQWALGSLPMLLTPIGMPNCRTYTSADFMVAMPASGGTATWTLPVPAAAAYFGTALYVQGVSFDPGANAASMTVSNAATLVLGH